MKEIIVCVDLNQDCIKTLKALPEKINLKDANVHFLHVFKSQLYDEDLSPFTFPLPEQYIVLEKSAIMSLKRLGDDLDLDPARVSAKCFFSLSPKEKIKSYLDETKADLVVIATRGRHGIKGLFSSSLADFLCKFSPCDILVLRP